jgi:nucleoside phosphorylase
VSTVLRIFQITMVLATMATLRPPSDRTHFHIAIICALPREADAVALLFDHFWDEGRDTFGRADNDTNTYITGRIGAHNVVLAVLPSMGTNSAAAAAASLRSSYTHIRLAALVGICGGVPRIGGLDVFLGDVVISKTIVQYDYGRQYPGHFAVKNTVEDSLARANKDIRGLLAVFETEHMRERLQSEATTHLQDLQQTARKKRRRAGYQFPGTAQDRLYRATYAHKHRGSCAACAGEAAPFCEGALKASCIELGCGTADLIERERPAEADGTCPEIFIGRIGSGNTVMKSGDDHDRIAAQHDIVAYEMEGAGAWDELPCLVVKGVCDYADSHKDKAWQDFAAATAAAVTKAVLGRYIARDEDRVPTRTSGMSKPWQFASPD